MKKRAESTPQDDHFDWLGFRDFLSELVERLRDRPETPAPSRPRVMASNTSLARRIASVEASLRRVDMVDLDRRATETTSALEPLDARLSELERTIAGLRTDFADLQLKVATAEADAATALARLDSHDALLVEHEIVLLRWRKWALRLAVLATSSVALMALSTPLIVSLPTLVDALVLTTAAIPITGAFALALRRLSTKSGIFLAALSFVLSYIGALAGVFYLLSERRP